MAFTKYKTKTRTHSLLVILAGVFTGIFGSSFSNYIQTIELERKQQNIINQMPIEDILKILDKKQIQNKKAKSVALKNKFDNKD